MVEVNGRGIEDVDKFVYLELQFPKRVEVPKTSITE